VKAIFLSLSFGPLKRARVRRDSSAHFGSSER